MNSNESVDKQIVQRMFHKSQRPIFTWQSDGSLLETNNMFKEFYDTEELTVQALIANDDRSIFESIINCLSNSNYMTLESLVSSNEDTQRVLWSHILTYDDKHKKHEIFSVGEVIEDLKLNTHLYNILYDRHAFEKTASLLFSEDKAFTIYLLDIDDFNRINELHGYSFGDYYLKILFESFLDIENYQVFKGSGDQLILIEETKDPKVISKSAKDIKDIVQTVFSSEDLQFTPTSSLGILTCPQHASDIVTLEQHMDIALNEAKNMGGNVIVFYNELLKQKLLLRRGIEAGITKAISRDEFEIFLQPIFDLKSLEYKKYEVLLRWPEAHKRGIYISQVIDVAEQTKQITEIDKYVIEKVFSIIKKERLNHLFSINLSAQSFYSSDFIEFIEEMIELYQINANQIELEITEYSCVKNIKMTKVYMDKIKSLGLRISLDDFGTEYSSLNYLGKLPFDVLKIDKSYVDGLTLQNTDRIIVKHLISIANELGLETIAEGIETREQLDILNELGCQSGQGYLISKPNQHKIILELNDKP